MQAGDLENKFFIMKKLFFFSAITFCSQVVYSQSYPNPEFSNEIYALRKDSNILMRLEKEFSRMNTKMKMAGMGGAESGYFIESEKSPVRLKKDRNYSFVYYTSSSISSSTNSGMNMNDMNPSMYPQAGMDPSQNISLYQLQTSKGKRKLVTMSATMMGKKESIRYSFSVKKIREGYYELIADKPLPKGEYTFMMMSYSSMDGSVALFAFAIE